ncbi:MAG: mechanosensitive ion channel family protein [Nanoarchaeota archaeon]|nr:mechanosensitive ion channel family protein [Nanoarchaeota archaeon]
MFEQYIANSYFRAFVIFIAVFLGTRIVLFILEKISLKITKKTKTELDDKLVKKCSMPLTIIAFLVSLKITINEILFQEHVEMILSNAIFSLLIIVLAYVVYVVVNIVIINFMKKIASKTKSQVDDSIISLFHSVLNIALIVISLLYILSIWGVQITPLLAGLGIAGLAIALALQPVLSNVFAGVSMVLDHSVRIEDLVYLDQQTKGKVEKIGLRSTRIRTFDNEMLIVPNIKLSESIIQNVALPEPKSRVVIQFSVCYGSNINKVKKILLKEIKKIKLISKEPEPLIRFLEMADSSLNFKVYFFVDSFENRFTAIDEANTVIYDALNKNNIGIPFPQIDVHVKK